jgi:RNA polymerase sigma factor (sigma-70 family)
LTGPFDVVILSRLRMAFFAKSTVIDVGGGEASPAVKSRVDELLPLARAASAGDVEAAGTLVAHLGRSMLVVVRRVLGRHCADVDDVAQDAVIAVLDGLVSFRGECSVFHFAQRVAMLTALSAQRRIRLREHWTVATEVPGDGVADDAGASPMESAASRLRRVLVRELLGELPDVIAEALGMHYMLGYTVEEIAAVAGISPNTVWSRLRLGKQALRKKLDGDAGLAERLEVRP